MNLRRRITAILYIVSVALSVFILAAVLGRTTETVQSTSYTRGIANDGDVFFAENRMGQGLIYRLSADGRILNLFSSLSEGDEEFMELSAAPESDDALLYAVLASDIEDGDGDELHSLRIVSLDGRLRTISKTPYFTLPEDEVLTGFSAESTGMFLTTVKSDGSSIHVYSIGRDMFTTDESAGSIRAESIRTRSAEEGRFFVQARYAFGTLEVRTDSDAPTASFAADPDVQRAVENMRPSLEHLLTLYRRYIIVYIAALLIWLVILGLLIHLLAGRNRMFYSFVITEAVLLAVTAIGVFTLHEQSYQVRRTEDIRFALLSMEELQDVSGISDYVDYSSGRYYETERYYTIRDALSDFVKRGGNRSVFYDALVVRLSDGVIVTSASGRNLESASWLFGAGMDDLIRSIDRGSLYAEEDITVDGLSCMAVGMAEKGSLVDYALVAVLVDNVDYDGLWTNGRTAFIMFLIIFGAASFIMVVVWYLQNRDLLNFAEALKETALGRRPNERPAQTGRDMKEMWDSLYEVRRLIEETNYSKFKLLEAYYRFAPKNIEEVLDKLSIMEVKSNDSRDFPATLSVVRLSGTEAIRPAQAMEDVIRNIGEYQKDHSGILCSMVPDLSSIELMFLEGEHETVSYMTSVICDHMQNGGMPMLSVTMFYDYCTFGVVGSDDEALTWHIAGNQEILYTFSRFFMDLGLNLVITEEVKQRERVDGQVRYIGYVLTEDGGEPIRFYEVLDACPARQRTGKTASLGHFADALELFYEKDFYLARNKFSDILRVTPYDALVKWYLFECDRYLDAGADDKLFGSFHL